MLEPTLWARLRRARAVQITVVYLGACWFVLQLVSTLQDVLALPPWIGPVTVVLLAVGLVVVLATAWVQSLPGTTAAEEAGDVPTDWEIAPADVIQSLRAGRLPHLTWGRAIGGGVVAISLAIGAAGAYVLVTQDEQELGPAPVGAASAHEGVAVLPFAVSGPGLDEFGEGMVSLVSVNIDGMDGIRSVNPRTVISAWTEGLSGSASAPLDGVLRVAGRTGARYAVVGDAVSTGSTVRFTAELYDLADGQRVGDGRAEGALEDVLALIDEMSVDLLRSLVARSGTQSATGIQRLDGLVTSSIAALSAYFEGEAHFREGRTSQALEAYERAVEADSTFALAWSRIASAYGWISPGSPALREARRRAMELIDRLPARDATLVRGYGDVSSATPTPGVLAELRRHVQRFPDDPEGWAVLGEYYLHIGGIVHTEEQTAEAVLTAVDLDPGFAPYYIHALRYLVAMGDWRFYEYMELYRGVADEEQVRRHQVQWDFFHGRDEARDSAEAFYQANPVSAMSTSFEVFLRTDSTAERSLDLVRMASSANPFVALLEAQILASLGRWDELRTLEVEWPAVLLARGGAAILMSATVDGLDPVTAAADISTALDAWALEAEADGEPMPDEAQSELRVLAEASRLLAGEQPARALRALEALPTRGGATAWLGWWPAYYAESLARTGETRRAIAQYESDMVPWRAVARLRLGELYESMGESERARENYTGFLRLFREADEGAAELVERARAGLARTDGGAPN
jgi:tetratricopeptide (TPR) repeat protein